MKPIILVFLVVACAAAASKDETIGRAIQVAGGSPHSSTRANVQANNFCLAEHNRVRSQNGKPTFTANGQLEAAARKHNEVMKAKRCFSHQCPGEPGLGDRASNEGYQWMGLGENIAMGHANCQQAVSGWMNSPGHKANILGNFKNIGCHQLDNYYTCVFGNPWSW